MNISDNSTSPQSAGGFVNLRRVVVAPVAGFGRGGLFFLQVLSRLRLNPRQLRSMLVQVYAIGVRSLVIIMTCGFFVGLVLGLQFYEALSQFGATNAVGTILGKSLFRELGPVLTGLLFAGRAGTAIAAEIGLMRATDQLSAMELMAIDPVERVVLPRFLGGLLSVPLLTALFNMMVILGGLLYTVGIQDVSMGIFWSNMQQNVDLSADYLNGFWKSLAFGAIVSIVAVFNGYFARPTGEGVGAATTQTVVVSAILILVFDYIISAFLT